MLRTMFPKGLRNPIFEKKIGFLSSNRIALRHISFQLEISEYFNPRLKDL